ncbi:Proteasomal ubiquitin receptor ADRM1 [Blattella germanica]|nr:Proteasomal ubiquitin receptor ADRM1 [Blattella germanica]
MPVGGALFGNTATRTQNKNLVECKAGKMTLKGKMVHPDKRKGLLYVYQSDDSLMHFCWKDRQTGTVEDDLIIFPDDCEFKRVAQCTTGRVYVLKFKSSSRKFFFWLQEPKTDKDDENCRRINEVLNNPPTPGSQRSGGGTPVESFSDGDLQNLLNNMSQQQLMQLFGGVGQIGGLSSLLGTMSRPSTGQSSRPTSTPSPTTSVTTPSVTSTSVTSSTTSTTTVTTSASSTTTPAATTTTAPKTAQPTIQLSDLQNFLSGLNVPVPPGEAAAGSNQRSGMGIQQTVDLSSALTMDNLQAVMGDPNLVRELQQHLPPSGTAGTPPPPASEQLRSTLASSQFRQALSMFSAALQSGQLGPVVQQFEVGAEAVNAANQGNMEDFIKALQNASLAKDDEGKQPGGDEKRKKKDDPPSEKEDDDDDEGMSLD